MAYWWTQPAHSKQVRKSEKDQAALPLQVRQTDKPYGGGQNVWVKKFDPDTAKIVSRFKADDYQPRNDGWIVVKEPRAQFFMKDGRAISVEGESGEIIMDDNHKTGMKALAGSRDTPSRGRLYNVTIYMYHGIDRPEEQLDEAYRDEKGKPINPAMTITLNNASFDNQTFKIYSEGFGKGKRHVEADMVPVMLRGEDYDFDGKGLVIRWNERDRRRQLRGGGPREALAGKHPDLPRGARGRGGRARGRGLAPGSKRPPPPLPRRPRRRPRAEPESGRGPLGPRRPSPAGSASARPRLRRLSRVTTVRFRSS